MDPLDEPRIIGAGVAEDLLKCRGEDGSDNGLMFRRPEKRFDQAGENFRDHAAGKNAARGHRGDRAGLEDEEIQAVEGPLDVLGRAEFRGDLPDNGREFAHFARGEERRPGREGHRELAARVDPVPIEGRAALDELRAGPGDGFDDNAALATDGVGAEGHSGRHGLDHGLDDDGHGHPVRGREVFLINVRPKPRPESRGQALADGGQDLLVAGDVENGVELAGVGGLLRILPDQGRPHGDGAAEAAVSLENGVPVGGNDVPGKERVADGLQVFEVLGPVPEGDPANGGGQRAVEDARRDDESGGNVEPGPPEPGQTGPFAAGDGFAGGLAVFKIYDQLSHSFWSLAEGIFVLRGLSPSQTPGKVNWGVIWRRR